MKKPKVSVIVALYNKEKEITKCIQSLLDQTLSDVEIIVVDDASTDQSLKCVREFNDSRITIFTNNKNMGIGFTRNNGIKHATGEYLGFVDADDYVEKDMYEKYYNFAKNNNYDLINANYFKMNNNSKSIFGVQKFSPTNIIENPNIINLINYGPCNKLFKTTMIKNNKILFMENSKFEDVLFIAKSIKNAKSIGYLDFAGYNYVIHGNSETTSVDKRTFDIFKVMDEVNKTYEALNETDELIYLNIVEITRYMLKQRYQKNNVEKKDFINKGYLYLNNINKEWRSNKYYLREPFLKRIIKNNKTFMSIYCKIMNRGD